MMKHSIVSVALCMLMIGLPVEAQFLAVGSDQEIYTLHDTIRITIHNPTAESVWCYQNPYYYLEHVDSGQIVDGGYGVAIMVEIEAGARIIHEYEGIDLLLFGGSIGQYRFGVYESGTGYSGQPPHPFVDFTLIPHTLNEPSTWSEVKALYR